MKKILEKFTRGIPSSILTGVVVTTIPIPKEAVFPVSLTAWIR
ncbi:MAG: hypothetical protein N3A69_01295 [Leptospiraceae bacterium]|nr:hypothetical protein [Leptospiraceae bacterium]